MLADNDDGEMIGRVRHRIYIITAHDLSTPIFIIELVLIASRSTYFYDILDGGGPGVVQSRLERKQDTVGICERLKDGSVLETYFAYLQATSEPCRRQEMTKSASNIHRSV